MGELSERIGGGHARTVSAEKVSKGNARVSAGRGCRR